MNGLLAKILSAHGAIPDLLMVSIDISDVRFI